MVGVANRLMIVPARLKRADAIDADLDCRRTARSDTVDRRFAAATCRYSQRHRRGGALHLYAKTAPSSLVRCDMRTTITAMRPAIRAAPASCGCPPSNRFWPRVMPRPTRKGWPRTFYGSIDRT